MPSLNIDENKSTYQIRAYQPGMIQVNEQKLAASLILTPNKLIADWSPQSMGELDMASLAPIIELHPTILLIGTGAQQEFLSIELYGELINQGIGVEVMTTSAACRTFNALSAEDRNVAAALIIK